MDPKTECFDDMVYIPAEAIEYIDRHLDKSSEPFLFEIIEAFFSWLSMQPIETQKQVLRRALINGRGKSVWHAWGC